MPRLLLPLRDKHNAVVRPIITAVIQDLKDITHLNPKTEIWFPGDTDHMKQTDSALGHEGERNRFGVDDFLRLEVQLRSIEDQILTNSADRVGDQFTFFDDQLEIYARPTRTFSEAIITVRYRSSSKAEAERWRDEQRSKVEQGRASLIHEPPSYSYDIPDEALVIYKELHRLRENKHGYGDSFHDWFLDRSAKFVTVITNQAGSDKADAYTIRESLERIQGAFDFPVEAEKGQYADGFTGWEISFTYTIQLDITDGYVMLYPVSAHNQLLDSKYIEHSTVYEQTNRVRGWSSGQYYTHTFEAQWRMQEYVKNRGLSIPSWDDFNGRKTAGLYPVLTVLLRLYEPGEGGDLLELLDFSQLGKLKLTPEVLAFLKSEHRWLTIPSQSIFALQYYRGSELIWEGDQVIQARPDGKVYAKYPLDPRQVHHVRLSVMADMDMLSDEALHRLGDNACLLRAYMSAIWPSFDTSAIKSRKGECGPVADKVIEDIRKERRDPRPAGPGLGGPGYTSGAGGSNLLMRTVGRYSIEGFFTRNNPAPEAGVGA